MALAANSSGYRRVADVLAEISYHLVEPVSYATATTPTLVSGNLQVTLPSLAGLYPGAQVVLGWQSSTAEILIVLSTSPVSPTPGPGTALLSAPSNTHLTSETLLGPTFSTQQPTDPLWTQVEISTYLARAQNDFLAKVPLVLSLSSQFLMPGLQYQATPPTTIEMERVAVVNGLPPNQTAQIASLTRVNGFVTATLLAPAPLPIFTPGLAIQVITGGTSFDTPMTSSLATVTVLANSLDGLTLSWQQAGADASATFTSGSGAVCGPPYFNRLYESSQEQLAMRDPAWQSNPGFGSGPPTNWYEDRTGVYQWGVGPIPRSSYYTELLTSQRDTETLGLLDGFLLPDIFIPYVKYGVLATCWGKDGEQRSPTLARFCQQRFDFGVMLAKRFLRNVVTKTGQSVFAGQGGG